MKMHLNSLAKSIFVIIFGSLASPCFASGNTKKTSYQVDNVNSKKSRNSQEKRTSSIKSLERDFRLGKLSAKKTWELLTKIQNSERDLKKNQKIDLLQVQAAVLLKGGYPITAAIYASQAIALADRSVSDDLKSSWVTLRKVAEIRPIQNFLEVVAESIKIREKTVPAFGSNWNYYIGNSVSRTNNGVDAIKYYELVRATDRDYLASRYQQAMLLIEQEKLKEAEDKLKVIINSREMAQSTRSNQADQKISDFAHMALGRIYYEQGRFREAIQQYRSVGRNGLNFYDALFEQSWAFFMGGYPMHALGALYAVESPFFEDVFNPEAPMLRALVHYWLCRYDDSRDGLADFSEKYAKDVEKLDEFLKRKRLSERDAYQLFENFISGVSEETLGISRSILKTAAEKDSMLLVRDQYASIIEEKNRLELKGLFGNKKAASKPLDYMGRWASALQSDIGKRFLSELQDIKKDYDQLYSQAEFLYVELLMSEKDQILGKELHASSKITQVSKRLKVSGWADKTQAWNDSRIGEYWWDEVGFYISPVDSQCRANN